MRPRPHKRPRYLATLTQPAYVAVAITVAVVLIAGIIAALTLTTPDHQAAAPAPTPTNADGLPPGVTQAGAVPTAVPNDPAARQNVHLTNCSASDGGWKATGTASNPGKTPLNYTITIFFTTDQATVLQTADTQITVDPGKNADWTIEKKFTPTPKTLCALRGVATK